MARKTKSRLTADEQAAADDIADEVLRALFGKRPASIYTVNRGSKRYMRDKHWRRLNEFVDRLQRATEEVVLHMAAP